MLVRYVSLINRILLNYNGCPWRIGIVPSIVTKVMGSNLMHFFADGEFEVLSDFDSDQSKRVYQSIYSFNSYQLL